MPQMFTKLRPYLFLLVLVAAGNAHADAGKDLFDKHCASCHSIGGGDGGGPDLKGVATRRTPEWLTRVIVEPGKLTAEKDPTQAELVKKYGFEMPSVGVNGADAAKIIAFLGGGSAPAKGGAPAASAPAAGTTDNKAAGATDAAAPAAPAEVVVTKELLATGRDLFTGKQRFANGGAPCVSCHALDYPGIYSGALAADLTGLYGKMGENGVRGVLKSLSFPVMKKIYAERPLNEAETTALTALFKDASARKHVAADPYPMAGLGFFALCLVAALLFKRRIK
ncbi:MAG TPA: cytochrome C [Geobacter sp.]|nr:cytochrome C [Geobacter sp.]